jgi:hypothetical protein
MQNIQRGFASLLCVIVIAGLGMYSLGAESPESGRPFVTTGVYTGSCGQNISVALSLPVPLFGLGNAEDPACDGVDTTLQLPVSFTGYLANLHVLSTEAFGSAPTTVTLYLNGNATSLSCTVSVSAPNCTDTVHRVSVQPTDAFNVQANCGPTTGNCSLSLEVTVDRQQPLGR